MITVGGFNTTLDRLIGIDTLRVGEVCRATSERIYPGGKGLHVAQTIAALGERVQLVGVVDAAHRNLIGRRMVERGVLFHGIEITQSMRNCLALQDASGQVTEVLGQGPELAEKFRRQLMHAFLRGVDESELAILSGSLPLGFSAETYAELAGQVHDAGRRCLIDASGDVLQQAAQAKPFLLKPNRDEISSLLGRPIVTLDDAIDAAKTLWARGVAMPLITMGALGAVAMNADGICWASIELQDVCNPVGSGDCLLAGVAVGLLRGESLEELLRLGVACGAANAMREETGYIDRADVYALLPKVRVQRL